MSTEGTVHSGNVAGGNLLSEGAANALIALVLKIRALVDWCGRWASLLFVPMIVITVYDVCLQKNG